MLSFCFYFNLIDILWLVVQYGAYCFYEHLANLTTLKAHLELNVEGNAENTTQQLTK